jgi:hypothetical protein
MAFAKTAENPPNQRFYKVFLIFKLYLLNISHRYKAAHRKTRRNGGAIGFIAGFLLFCNS